MKITVQGNPKEIAAVVVAIQQRNINCTQVASEQKVVIGNNDITKLKTIDASHSSD